MLHSPQNLMSDEIVRLQDEIAQKRKEILLLRRQLPPQEVADYPLTNWEGKRVMLSELFSPAGDLVVIHNMGRRCVYCTLWADGFNGAAEHFADRAGFVVVSPDSPEIQREFALGRGWKFRMLSAAGGSFIRDMGFEEGEGDFLPGVSTFHKDAAGKIWRVAVDYFGPGDFYSGIWHIFDLLKGGSGDWEPKYSY